MSCHRFSLRRAGGVGVSQLVHESDLGSAGQDGSKIHLLQRGAPVGHLGPRDDLEALDEFLGVLAPVSFDKADDHIGAPLSRRWPSSSILYVFPTPGAAPK